MANTDPFSSSVIPFEVPEQMRAFAEKGVFSARDSYAKFKDVGREPQRHLEAVFFDGQQGRQRIFRQADGIMKASTTANLDFAQELISVKSPSEALGAVDLARTRSSSRLSPP